MKTLTFCLFSLMPLWAVAQQPANGVVLIDSDEQAPQLSELDRQYIVSRLDTLDLDRCQQRPLRQEPRIVYRRLTLPHKKARLTISAAADVMRTNSMVIYQQSGQEWTEYYDCPQEPLLPVLAIIATAKVGNEEIGSNGIRQTVLARHSQLSSLEASKLMLRTDSNDINAMFLDFTVSSKHPLFAQWPLLEESQAVAADVLERVIPGDEEYLMQLYLGFTGRFSQYIGTRDSSPVTARRFNPSVFYRMWSSDESWLDLGFAHESNGQRVNTPAGLLEEERNYVTHGEDPTFARDSLSRGWDYAFIDWRLVWNTNLNSQLRLQHYKRKGLLQGPAEEYNLWEDGGVRNRPRRQYDGVTLALQYNFNSSRCFLGDSFICFKEFELTQTTGYSKMFENNTTTLEFTTDVFGLPIQLWTKTGYNSDLVDYYQYVNSWGLGFELMTP
ncbi:MAG: hypothetical protein V4603_03525 [Pseudomonadota bacterium]